MRLTALTLENFKQFERAHVTFAPGFTVIKGPNEAGKSSIQAAILGALFLDPQVAEQDLSEYIRWGQDQRFRLCIEFEQGNRQYRLSKDFQAGTLMLEWQGPADGTGGSTRDPAAALATVGGLLGAPSVEVYVNTACIRSDEISKAPTAGAPISRRLQVRVTGGRRAAADEVIQAMEHELVALASGGPRHLHETGALRLSRERIASLHRSRSAAAAKLASHQENLRLSIRLRKEHHELEAATAERAAALEFSDRAQTLEADCALLGAHLQELERAEILRESIGEAAEHLSDMDYPTIAGGLERAQSLERQLNEQKLREAEISRELAVIMLSQLQQAPTVPRGALILGGIVVATTALALAVAAHLPAVAAGVLPALALIALGLRDSRPAPLDTRALNEELRLCTERIKVTQVELTRLLSRYKLDSVEELATVGRELRPTGELRGTHEQRIAQILGTHRTGNRRLAMEQVTREIERRRAELAQLGECRLTAEEYERIDHELEALRLQLTQVQREMDRLEGELRANDVDSEKLAVLDEELQVEQVHMARLERRRKVLERALSSMREARAATLAQASSVFRTGVAKHLAPMTGGRYDQVDARIDEEGLHLLVYTTDKHRAVKADSLSRATQDQIYLAARLALLELACDGCQPPLLFDDPFVNYDDTRVENTMCLLRRLYAPYQIVLFTCTDRYDRYADQVISLAGPRMPAGKDAQIAAS